MQVDNQFECFKHREGTIFIECHSGLVCKGCHRESVRMSCDICNNRICGVTCKGLLGRTIHGIVLVCIGCYQRTTNHAPPNVTTHVVNKHTTNNHTANNHIHNKSIVKSAH